jgi:enoyl-CoA hydratase/carnithine racemase
VINNVPKFTNLKALFNHMERSPLIMVAAINGLCYGGGLEFALACDFRFFAETSRMGLLEVLVGIIPGGGGTQRLPCLVGKGRALEMIMTGHLYNADDALTIGLVHRVCPRAELWDATVRFLEPMFKNPQHALSNAKIAINFSAGLGTRACTLKENPFARVSNRNFLLRKSAGN